MKLNIDLKKKEEHNKYAREWREKNKDRLNRKIKEDRKENPEKYKKYDGKYYKNNKDKYKEYAQKNKKKIRKNRRKSYLKQIYNLTEEKYNKILKQQRGVCAICKNGNGKKNLFVDHYHKTGKIRGLLCHHCNSSLGFFDEDINIIKNVIKYLEKYK